MPYTGFRASNTDQSLEIRDAHDGEEAEPDQHHRAEYFADAFGAARLHGEEITMITTVIIRVRLGFSSNNPSNGGRVCKPSTAELMETAG